MSNIWNTFRTSRIYLAQNFRWDSPPKPALLTISQDYIHIDNRTWVPHKASKKPKYVDKFWFNIASSYLLPHNCFRHSLFCNQGHVVKWNPNKYPLDPICDGIAADDKPSNCDMVCIEVSHTFYNEIALASSEKAWQIIVFLNKDDIEFSWSFPAQCHIRQPVIVLTYIWPR